jgi:hypothetical protein
MGIPIGLVNKIKATFKEAPKPVVVVQKEEVKDSYEQEMMIDTTS